MSMIELFSNDLAKKVCLTLNYDNEKEQVIAYGAFYLFQTLWSIILVIVFGLVFDVWFESLIISFASAILRKYSGGAHATSPNRCAIIGVITFVGAGLIIKATNSVMGGLSTLVFSAICFLITYIIIYRLAPVDTPTKRITKEELRQSFRKGSFVVTHIMLSITIVLLLCFIYLNYRILIISALSISTGVLWQSITLTSLGNLIISNLDVALKNISSILGGEKR